MPGAPRGPRRRVLDALREITAGLRGTVSRWHIDSKVPLPPAQCTPGNYHRTRLVYEYPENDPAAWRSLIQDMDTVMRLADEIKVYARSQLAALDNERRQERW